MQSLQLIFVANLLQFESRSFPKLIFLMLRFVDGTWTRSEKIVKILFLKIKYLLQYYFVSSRSIIFQNIDAKKNKKYVFLIIFYQSSIWYMIFIVVHT